MRHHYVRICSFTVIVYACFVVFVHANQNVITSYFCPSILDGIPDQVVKTGKIFQYQIPDRAFRMSEDAYIKISTASENSSLPEWISYNPERRELLAVPTIHDGYGIYLKVTVEDQKSTCRSVSDVFHLAVMSWTPDFKQKQSPTHLPKKSYDTKKSRVCRGVDLIQTTLIFAVNLKDLWAIDRLKLVKNLARFLGVDSSVITVSTGNELFSTQDNSKSYSILASGHGNTVSIVPNATELTWQVPCSVFPEVHLFVQVLQHNVEGGRLTSEVGYDVVGWYISALVNPSKQQLGRKKRFAQRFMTPVPTPVPDLVPATKVKSSSVLNIVPTTTLTTTSSSSSRYWWWWPETKEDTKTISSTFLEETTTKFSPTDKMTKPFPPQSEIIGHTLTASSHSSRISPTKSSYFISLAAATPHTKSPSSSFPETTTSNNRAESIFPSESPRILTSISSLTKSQTSTFEMLHSTDYHTKSHTDVYTTYSTITEESKSYTDLDGISGSGDSTYTDEDTIPVIETTVLPSTETFPPTGLFITPSSPIKKPEEDIHSVTDMPYAGSGSGFGSDDEETPVIIQPSSHASSETLSVPTPSLSSVIDSSETNIFYFEETASTSTSKHIGSSIYIPSWDADRFTSSKSSSWEIWITKDPWASKDNERKVTESTTDLSSSKMTDHHTDMWYSRKADSSDGWSSKETEPYTDTWYSKKDQSTDVWSSKETVHSTGALYSEETKWSREPAGSKTSDYTWGGLWPEETKHTKEILHASSFYHGEIMSSETVKTHATLSSHYSTITKNPSSSMESYPYSNPSSRSSSDIKSSISTELQGEISPSTSSNVPTTSRFGSVYIEEESVTKHGEKPSKYDSAFSSQIPDSSTTSTDGFTMIPDDCLRSGLCTTGSTLEASSTQTHERWTPTRSSSTTESTSVTPMIPVSVSTQKKQRITTLQPTTEQRRITKKPKKRPTLPPITKTTDYMNKAPKVRTAMGSAYAAVGTVFKFQIPKNTFHDQEDGNTRRLTLNVAYCWGPRCPQTNSNSWLEFDEATQTLTGLPLEEDVKQSPMEVTINAIDKGGKLAQDIIMIHVNSTMTDLSPAYEFVMKFEVNGKKFLAERKHLRNLMKKLSSFFGDRDSSYITILDAKPGSLILTWTNNSVPMDRCDNETVHEQRRKIFDDNDRINPKFRKYMSPRFTVLDAEFNLDGACLDTEPRTIGDAETGDIAEVNPWAEAIIPTVIAVAIAIFIVVIILLICSQKQRQKKKQKSEQRNSFEDQDPVMFHSERSNPDRGMRSKRAVILPGDVNPNNSIHRNFTPYQASGFGEQDNVSEYDDVESESGRYSYNNGSTNPPPPYRLPPPYYPDNGSSYV